MQFILYKVIGKQAVTLCLILHSSNTGRIKNDWGKTWNATEALLAHYLYFTTASKGKLAPTFESSRIRAIKDRLFRQQFAHHDLRLGSLGLEDRVVDRLEFGP